MPKAPIPVNSVKVEAIGHYGPALWANVFYFELGAGPYTVPHVFADCAAAVKDFYASAMTLASFTTDWVVDYEKVTYRDASDSMQTTRVADGSAGSGTSPGQDAQCCLLINWATNDPRKGGKPRTYICGLADGVMADVAHITTGFQTGRAPLIASWLAALPGGPYANHVEMSLVDMSFRDAKAWRTDPVPFPIFAGSVNPVVATQRRRVDRLRPS